MNTDTGLVRRHDEQGADRTCRKCRQSLPASIWSGPQHVLMLAMIPLTRSVFWGPMAISIMGGLVAATALTLVFVPALYAARFKVRRPDPSTETPAGSFTPGLALAAE